MLAKLMKYEVKATARYFLPLYGAILVLSTIMGLRGFKKSWLPFLEFILPTALGLAFVGLFVMTLIMVVKRFDANLLSDEGYLMFTLPVKTHALIQSKALVSLLWILASSFVFLLSIGLLIWREENVGFILREIPALLGRFPMVFLILANILMGALNFLLMVYASLALAQARAITRNRILGGTIVFIVLSIIFNVVETVIFTVSGFFLRSSAWVNNLVQSLESAEAATIINSLTVIFLFSLVYLLVKNVLLYFLTHYFLDHQLNLE